MAAGAGGAAVCAPAIRAIAMQVPAIDCNTRVELDFLNILPPKNRVVRRCSKRAVNTGRTGTSTAPLQLLLKNVRAMSHAARQAHSFPGGAVHSPSRRSSRCEVNSVTQKQHKEHVRNKERFAYKENPDGFLIRTIEKTQEGLNSGEARHLPAPDGTERCRGVPAKISLSQP